MYITMRIITSGLAFSTHFLLTQAAPLLANNFGRAAQNTTFDYVVVGGGTGGLAIAYRLAEANHAVAVSEAGGFYEVENGNTSVVPAYNQDYNEITSDSQWNAPLVDWGFLTTPQAGAQGQRLHYGRGKMLGGCSAENAMNYNRPTIGSLQAWSDSVNDTSYLWDNFLPHYQTSIKYTNPDQTFRAMNASVPLITSENGTGPLQVSFPHWATPIASWAKQGLAEIGVGELHNLVNGDLTGAQFSPLTLNPRDQTRSSSQTSFLDTAMRRRMTNLKVYTHTLAKEVLFDQNKTAAGVLVESGPSPESFILSAKKEVILSAGAFQSPQLLMVSGIGPAKELQKFNISVVADRPGVGQDMWDHVVLSVGQQVNVETYGSLMNPAAAVKARNDYLSPNHTGILTNDQSDFLGWEKLPSNSRSTFTNSTITDLATFPSDWPEIEYEISSAPFGTSPFSTPENVIDVGYIQPVLLTPLSRGNITLASADMSDAPLINPNWLTHPTDQQVAIAAFKRARQFFNTSAIAPILIGEELLPGQQDLPFNSSDEEILSYLQANIGFNWHASCTCKMGKRDDGMAVVDSRAKVIGVERLRVVDASAFPFLPPGHPQATIYALAEKIAGDILAGR
ncbi:alcohol oxidase [Aureobasidium pullulans]|uniref:Alcohol oxidase n=1 Tax=Aureobasidium pullulans TaxID=5580 RepID=A0A4T0BPE1_AURPU|nr:alcohol oxidase [Aureobasidium pullulans]